MLLASSLRLLLTDSPRFLVPGLFVEGYLRSSYALMETTSPDLPFVMRAEAAYR